MGGWGWRTPEDTQEAKKGPSSESPRQPEPGRRKRAGESWERTGAGIIARSRQMQMGVPGRQRGGSGEAGPRVCSQLPAVPAHLPAQNANYTLSLAIPKAPLSWAPERRSWEANRQAVLTRHLSVPGVGEAAEPLSADGRAAGPGTGQHWPAGAGESLTGDTGQRERALGKGILRQGKVGIERGETLGAPLTLTVSQTSIPLRPFCVPRWGSPSTQHHPSRPVKFNPRHL